MNTRKALTILGAALVGASLSLSATLALDHGPTPYAQSWSFASRHGVNESNSWEVVRSRTFNLDHAQTLTVTYQLSYYPSGGDASYLYVGQSVDGKLPQGAVFVSTNGAGASSATLVVQTRLAAGSHSWKAWARTNSGTTTYNEAKQQGATLILSS